MTIAGKCIDAKEKEEMMNVGMVGVGCISGIYLKNFKKTFKNVRLVAVCDLIRERAETFSKDLDVDIIDSF